MKNLNNKNEIKITRLINAPRQMVWDAWVKPEQIMKWWGPKDFTCPIVKVDFRVGGKYLCCMRGRAQPDQPIIDFWSGGKYIEIDPLNKIICTDMFSNEKGELVDPVEYGMSPDFPKENEVVVTFQEQEGKTKLTIAYILKSDEALKAMVDSQMEEGWGSSLDKLVESLG